MQTRSRATTAVAFAVFLITLGFTIVIAGSAGAHIPAARSVTHVKIADFAFHPATLRVKAGGKIQVTNDDTTTHTFTANKGAFDTGKLAAGATHTITVKRPGSYQYHCDIHDYMTGTIKVT